MAYVINDSCISCGSCEGQCPVGAIAQGDGKFEINEDTCVDCGTCAAQCPVSAIEPQQNVQKEDADASSFLS